MPLLIDLLFATPVIFLYVMSRAIDPSPLEAEKKKKNKKKISYFFFFHIQIDK